MSVCVYPPVSVCVFSFVVLLLSAVDVVAVPVFSCAFVVSVLCIVAVVYFLSCAVSVFCLVLSV